MTETVNHPPHYQLGGIEVIDAIEAWKLGFHLGNAVKYIARAAHKGKLLEDLKKARWYLDRAIDNLQRELDTGIEVKPPTAATPTPQPGDDELLGYWILPSAGYPSWWVWGFGPEELWREAGDDPQGFSRKSSRELAILACAADCERRLKQAGAKPGSRRVEVSSPVGVAAFGTVKNG